MTNDVSFFAINADDVARARRFYEQTFGWRFEPWGPPNFYLIETSGHGVRGCLQERRELVKGARTIGYECTIDIADIDATIKAVTGRGGAQIAPKFHIPTVGTVAYFTDPEGNAFGVREPERP
jgi:predicted enzyme related to lactoylglutathione lyase